MNSRHYLVFSLAFAVLFIGPALLPSPFPFYPLMKTGDVLDLLTPIVLIPLYWGLLSKAALPAPRPRTTIAFLVLSALWTLGQGMHLAANSIGHQLESLQDSEAYALTLFYDETLSHYLWHLGVMGLSGLIVLSAWRSTGDVNGRPPRALAAAAIIYGLTYSIIVIEGGTWPVGLPFAGLLAAAFLWTAIRDHRSPASVWYFGLANLISLGLLVGWGLYWGGFPEFSQLGWI